MSDEPATLTTTRAHGFAAGDRVVLTGQWAPWYKRLWRRLPRWLTRYRPPTYTISSVSETTLEIHP